MPVRNAGRHAFALGVRFLMADITVDVALTSALGATLYIVGVDGILIALERRIARRMAIDASRRKENLRRLVEGLNGRGSINFLRAGTIGTRGEMHDQY